MCRRKQSDAERSGHDKTAGADGTDAAAAKPSENYFNMSDHKEPTTHYDDVMIHHRNRTQPYLIADDDYINAYANL